MTDPNANRDDSRKSLDNLTGDGTRNTGENAPPGTPRWVWITGIIGVILVLLFVIVLFVGGDHGPGRHIPTGDANEYIVAIAHRLSSL